MPTRIGVPWLHPGATFPPTRYALDDPNGLLAIGNDLGVDTLLQAYRRGIFPWFSEGQPPLWWTPDPRLVLEPDAFHISRSLRKCLRRDPFQFSIDQAFTSVMSACAAPRDDQDGTWITDEMRDAYTALHHAGHAHSVEVWQGQQLVGGFYGVNLGAMFFGESMFSRCANASKAALALFCLLRNAHGVTLIDCQMETPHLLSLGARPVARVDFERALMERVCTDNAWHWPHERASLAEYTARYRLTI
ncbi:leucyl/phenylalanyl-tRNA--protein transferase [Isoalcanivorax indicus]|uniref:leucyl/phenylalanyl-tRNA--protein transferase n=1 Tax=Isoalcanivorax indicus TaxID=2202653 RepID=UPI000DBA08AB|nr:leucyl/phenylalanyl-tRNA--protein transferase [Isoalcanivorax indicus]